MPKSYQLRNFVFTWNNPGKELLQLAYQNEEELSVFEDCEDEEECAERLAHKYIKDLYRSNALPIQYITYGVEYGEKGTLHFQGYCELEKRVAFDRVAEFFDNCHIERRLGSQQQAIDYCRKEGMYHSYGTQKIQGDRTDIQYIKSLLDNNSSIKTLLEDQEISSIQGLKAALILLRFTDKPRTYKPNVMWLYGESGLGKTHTAMQVLPNAYFKTNTSSKWWPNYDGEENVIIDDVRRDQYPFLNMLGLLDRYSYQVEDKGVIRQFRGKNIILTSPQHPEEIYKLDKELNQESLYQLTRRIDLIIPIPSAEISISEAWCHQNELQK